ncbi:MAG: hypothetical protein MUF50_04060, partial [Planctomycetes bacterium]|nr:hypothetical protein [Planctomycetota bacterium]
NSPRKIPEIDMIGEATNEVASGKPFTRLIAPTKTRERIKIISLDGDHGFHAPNRSRLINVIRDLLI